MRSTVQPSHTATLPRLVAAVLACAVCAAGAFDLAVQPSVARAQAMATQEEATPRELRSVKIDEKLDASVPLDATFRDANGKSVRLGDVIDGRRPTLLTFAYFNCPVLCSLILNSATSSLAKVAWTIGHEFDVVTISIDPSETAERARSKKASLVEQYGRPGADTGWHFLMGDATQIARVTDAVGYRFHYDEETKQYAHPGALILLQPNGRVSRYLYGLEYPPNDLRLGLLEASEGKLISTAEQVLMFCYRYDAHEGKYVVAATRVMQVGAAGIALIFGSFLALFWYRERKSYRATGTSAPLGLGVVGPRNGAVTPMETRT